MHSPKNNSPPNMAPAIFAPLGLSFPPQKTSSSTKNTPHFKPPISLKKSHISNIYPPNTLGVFAPACGAFLSLEKSFLPPKMPALSQNNTPQFSPLTNILPPSAARPHLPRQGFSNPFYFAHFSYNIPPRNTSSKTSIRQAHPVRLPPPAGLSSPSKKASFPQKRPLFLPENLYSPHFSPLTNILPPSAARPHLPRQGFSKLVIAYPFPLVALQQFCRQIWHLPYLPL